MGSPMMDGANLTISSRIAAFLQSIRHLAENGARAGALILRGGNSYRNVGAVT